MKQSCINKDLVGLNIHKKGMTLIEILIVIALLGSLIAYLATKLTGSKEHAELQLAKMAMNRLHQDLDRFSLTVGRYPSASEGLDALVSKPGGVKGWAGPYTDKKNIKDPWGNKFDYQAKSRKEFVITSSGPNGEWGDDDDLKYPDDEENE